jgi:plasmid maintenance system antidote protein VapI
MARTSTKAAMPKDELRLWLERNRLTVRAAAAALGLHTRTIDGYLSGRVAIPRVVALACAAYDMGLAPRVDALAEIGIRA